MVFCCHPVDRDKVVLWVQLFELLTAYNSGNNFVDEIQRPCKEAQLVACGNRKGVFLTYSLYIMIGFLRNR